MNNPFRPHRPEDEFRRGPAPDQEHRDIQASRQPEERSWREEDRAMRSGEPQYGGVQRGQGSAYRQQQPGPYAQGPSSDYGASHPSEWSQSSYGQSGPGSQYGQSHDRYPQQASYGAGRSYQPGRSPSGAYGQGQYGAPGQGMSPGMAQGMSQGMSQGLGPSLHQGQAAYPEHAYAPGSQIWDSPDQPARGQGWQSSSHQPQHSEFEPDYLHWRNQQLTSFDNDYRSWRDEKRQKFSSEFDSWRSGRPRTMGAAHPTPAANPIVGDVSDGGVGSDGKKKI